MNLTKIIIGIALFVFGLYMVVASVSQVGSMVRTYEIIALISIITGVYLVRSEEIKKHRQ
jgi:Na+/H+ antiporter NhaD/arsenite permease-like protein